MAYPADRIKMDFIALMKRGGGKPRDWYIGAAEDPVKKLEKHSVRQKGDWWIYRQSISSEVAVKLVKHFMEQLNTAGSPEATPKASFVYLYQKGSRTKP